MISILIPIYNFNVVSLVQELADQCKLSNATYEIVCYDDCSEMAYKKANRVLDSLVGVSYLELSENLGRSKIRNWLAKNARYEKLIFIDCDSEIQKKDFVQKYIDIASRSKVIYGGRIYESERPQDDELLLHWHYGRKREALPLKQRLKNPYRSFQTNNFMIDRSLILNNPFNEEIKGYGYEDLMIANTFKNKGIPILHVENPLIHKGLEAAQDFLNKSKHAAENLAILFHQNHLDDTKMVVFHKKLKMFGFNSLLNTLIRRRKSQILKNLRSQNPNLFYFDLYRYEIFSSKLNEQ